MWVIKPSGTLLGQFLSSFSLVYSKRRSRSGGIREREMAGERRWEDMEMDCLVAILQRLGLQDLTLSVPLVRCPRLKKLVLPNLSPADEADIPKLVGKWKDLEQLEMESKPSSFLEMLSEINLHCKKFSGLKLCGSIKKEDMLAIVNLLPKLKFLCLSKSYLPREQLMGMLSGCKQLQRLTVSDCIGFEADEEVKKRGSGIKIFEHEGSKLFDDKCLDHSLSTLNHLCPLSILCIPLSLEDYFEPFLWKSLVVSKQMKIHHSSA
ncbi:hypothetical protein B296_00004489 [Ensete ventricosum]|uniref:Uncharacterized protein n=1 Tax=Ensete ventricosum TaxID=4639 RepID=A0A427BCB3_ENSVE|nr:hypothetical protein B296_00004489 [Ensete ventricosum]